MNLEKVTKEYLIEEYVNKKLTAKEISKDIGCSDVTIGNYLKKFNIPKETQMFPILTKKFLTEHYLKRKLSTLQISKIVGCGSKIIIKYLKKYNIPIRGTNVIITKEFLIKEYVENKKSTPQIAKELGCDPTTIRNKLFGNKIKIRTLNEALKGRKFTNSHLKNLLKSIHLKPNKFELKGMSYLNKIYPCKFKYVGDGSFIINGRSPDAYSKELNTVVLFHGDFYHCNPKKYKVDYYNKYTKRTAQQIWDRDRKAVETFKKAGYNVVIIWESDL